METNPNIKENKIGSRILSIFMLFIVIVLCCIICWLNIYKLKVSVDTDYIAEINYGREIYEKKSILPDMWVMGSEMMFGHPAILFPIFYALTSNYLLSYSLVLIVALILFILSIIYFLRSLNLSNNLLILGIIILLSFGGGG